MAHFVALLPRRDAAGVRVGFFAQVVHTAMQPVAIAVDMELFEVSELVQRVVLQVVDLDLVILAGLGLVRITVQGLESRRNVGQEVLRVVARMVDLT